MGKARRKGRQPDRSVHGIRYDKSAWEPIVRRMLDKGATYVEVAKILNASTTTVTRFVWEIGLASHDRHRHSIRAHILRTGGRHNVLRATKV